MEQVTSKINVFVNKTKMSKELSLSSTEELAGLFVGNSTETPHFSRKLVVEMDLDLSDEEKQIVHKVEKILGKKLKEAVYAREKCKILHNLNRFKILDAKYKLALRKLLKKKVSDEQIFSYISLCIRPNEKVRAFVENKLSTRFKETYLDLLKCGDNKRKVIYKKKLLMEWNYLTKFLSEDEVFVYAFNVAKGK